MKLTIAIPCSNQLYDTKVCWGAILATVKDKENVEILAILDGDTEGTKEFLNTFIFPYFADHRIIEHERHGVLRVMDEAWIEAKGEVIAILHNDVAMLEFGWDQRIIDTFKQDPTIGLAGFLGAEAIGSTGGRQNTWSNLVEAEIHGSRESGNREVMMFDGLSLIGRREMFEKVGGFDQRYSFHHFYDRDISLASHAAGYRNMLIGVYCHHLSGITANRPEYQEWISQQMKEEGLTGDQASYYASERHFLTKWQHYIGPYMRWYHQKG